MNREELMAMTDEELRIKAAELMGWEDVACREVNNLLSEGITFHTVCAKQDSGPNADKDAIGWLVGDGENMWDVVPDYPNDIAAAWELWERIPLSDRYYGAIHIVRIPVSRGETAKWRHGIGYGMSIGELGGPSEQEWKWQHLITEWPKEGETSAQTTARAITRAFILAMAE